MARVMLEIHRLNGSGSAAGATTGLPVTGEAVQDRNSLEAACGSGDRGSG